MKQKILHLPARFFAVCAATICSLILFTPLHAAADEKQYSVEQANFKIELNENGDAVITEDWSVKYTKGSFTRFYKDIFNPGNQLEYMPRIEVLGGRIDGTDAVATDYIDRVSYHYFFDDSNPQMYTIHWFKAAENQTVNYEITYRVPNAVKLDENDEAKYCYRLVGQNFPKTVGSLHASVYLPGSNAVHEASISSGDYQITGDRLDVDASRVSGMYMITLKMDAQYFSDLTRIISVQVPANLSSVETEPVSRSSSGSDPTEKLAIGLVIFMVALVPALIFGLMFSSFLLPLRNQRKVKKMLEENPNCFADAAERIQNSGIPYVWFSFPSVNKATALKTSTLFTFYTELFELCRKEYLRVTKDGIIFLPFNDSSETDSLQREMNRSFLDILLEFFPVKDELAGACIPFSRIYKNSDNLVMVQEFYRKILKWKNMYHADVTNSPLYQQLSQNGTLNDLQKDFELWMEYAQYTTFRTDLSECFAVLERGGSVNAYSILMLMRNIIDSTVVRNSYNGGSEAFISFVDASFISASTSHSSSTGHSCSSCSSCGGCGGGGCGGCGGGGAD